jgi:hypothetical protein
MRRYRRRNPLTSTEDLVIAGFGLAVAGLIGYAIYSKGQATAAAPANPNISTAPSQAQQEAYDTWVMQQIQLGNVSPAQASAAGAIPSGG